MSLTIAHYVMFKVIVDFNNLLGIVLKSYSVKSELDKSNCHKTVVPPTKTQIYKYKTEQMKTYQHFLDSSDNTT